MRLFSTEPSQQDQEAIHSLSHDQLARRQAQQDARKQPPAPGDSTNIGVLFALAVIAVPLSLVIGLLQRDIVFAFGAAALWFVIGVALYLIIEQRAGYWREHWLLAREQLRRTAP